MTFPPFSFIALIFKRILPQSLLGRSLLIIITPLLLVQVILGHIYFDRHTESILKLLSKNIAGEISLALEWMETNPNIAKIQKLAKKNLDIEIAILPKNKLDHSGILKNQWLYQHLRVALDERINKPYFVRMTDDHIFIQVESKHGVLECKMSRKKLFSRTIPLVLIWTSVSALLLFLVASMFMRNQIRPIKRLAKAAEAFGRGDETIEFYPEGALEVRQATIAFLMMKERITRLLQDRMQMLAGVSHDLRTPLTRIKLQVAMMEDSEEKTALLNDANEMHEMLEEYLAYARGSFVEKMQKCDICKIIREVCGKYNTPKFLIRVEAPASIKILLKPETFNRLLTNLIVNSTVYSTCLDVQIKKNEHNLEVILDDNGPGIPEKERENVFKPFYRLDSSRSMSGSNVGLGLSIVRDAVRSHGGQIALKESPAGGLRVLIHLPL